ncbi:MAG: hypothetical protein C0395_07015 [Gemmatimonas sp.]|nr:hypothetical protein [Gemmatimonas sp.]
MHVLAMLLLTATALWGGSPVTVTPEIRDVPGHEGSGRVQLRYRLELSGEHRWTDWTRFPGDTLTVGWTAAPHEFARAIDCLLDPAVPAIPYGDDLDRPDGDVRREALDAIFASREMRAYLGGRNACGRRLTRADLALVGVGAVGIGLPSPAHDNTVRYAMTDPLRLGKLACLARFAVTGGVEHNDSAADGREVGPRDDVDVIFMVPEGDVWLDDVGWVMRGVVFSFGYADD